MAVADSWYPADLFCAITMVAIYQMEKKMSGNSRTFNREKRYLVFKCKDIDLYLSSGQKATLFRMGDVIKERRDSDGRVPMNCVVVEHDWPESEAVWSMIEARMTGGVNFVDWQAHRIQELEQENLLLKSALAVSGSKTDAK